MKKLYYCRHGITALNVRGITQGRIDEPLSEKGVEQAKIVRKYFDDHHFAFEKLYVSPLKRAVSSASIISDLKPVIKEGLIEQDFGSLDGLDYQLTKPYNGNFSSVGGEDSDVVGKRIHETLKDILKEIDDNALIVGHGSSIRAFIKYLKMDVDVSHIPNMAVFVFECDENIHFVEMKKIINDA